MDYDSSSSSSSDDDDAALMCLIAQQMAKYQQKPLKDFMSLQAKRNRSGKIRRGALLKHDESPFKKLFDSGQDDALIAVTGFDHATFDKLLEPFQKTHYDFSPCSKDEAEHAGIMLKLTNSTFLLFGATEWCFEV